MGARCLTDEERAEVSRRYSDGESAGVLSAEYNVARNTIVRHLRQMGVEIRSRQQAAFLWRGSDSDWLDVSDRKLLELYQDPRYRLSPNEIARIYRVSGNTVRSRLKQITKQRSISEQQRIDYAHGRRESGFKSPNIRRFRGPFSVDHMEKFLKAGSAPSSRMKAAATKHRNYSMTLPCGWCGEQVTRPQSAVIRQICCNGVCSGRLGGFRRQHGPESPRPLIVEKLRAACYPGPYTYERVQRKGERLGAREVEVFAVLEAVS